MSQATDWSVPLSGPVTPNEMADRMDKSLDALLSSHSGASRPAYAVAGTVWLSTAVAGRHQYYHYDGVADRLIMTIETATGAVVFADNAATIHAAATKSLVVAADEIGFWDSVSSELRKIAYQDFVWQCRVGVGQRYYVDTSKTGAELPPSGTSGPVFIELAAGLTGAGQFNNGKLSGESVSGSAPLVLATAVISFASSPMVGQAVDLVMTEGRIERPSTSPGTKQNDAQQNITASLLVRSLVGSATGAFVLTNDSSDRSATGTGTGYNLSFDASRVARTDIETRMKNGGVKAYMRVK